MKFKGKIDWWFWIVMLVGEALVLSSLFASERVSIIGAIVLVMYNLVFLPFVIRNYVEVTDEKVTVAFGFSKDSIPTKEIQSVYCTHNPIASSAASLDRIVIEGRQRKVMCAVKEKDQLFSYLKEKNPEIVMNVKAEKHGAAKLEKGVFIFTLVVFVLIGVLLLTGDIKMYYGENTFTIEASYYKDMEISYDEIDHIEYRDEKVSGSRVGGFASFRLMMGKYKNDEFGKYTRYTYANCDAGVVLRVDDREIVISGKDKESTKEIYEKIMDRYVK